MRGRGFNFLNRVFQPLRVLTARKLLLEKISILLVTFGLARPEACPQLDWGARAKRIFVLVCQGHLGTAAFCQGIEMLVIDI